VEAFGAKLFPIPVPSGARAKEETLARLPGREWLGAKDVRPLARDRGRGGGAAISPRFGEDGWREREGRVVVALGREASLRVGDGGAWPIDGRDVFRTRGSEGVSCASAAARDSRPLVVLPFVRFLLRTVTEEGMLLPRADVLLGDDLSGVRAGAGSFDFSA
jgi:hypothetical protein